jgi:hypothetical protein
VSRQKIGIQWRKYTIVVQKSILVVDHAELQFWYYLLTFLGKLYFKLQKFITYSYNIQIIYILMLWNPLENWEKTHNFFVILIIVSSVSI